MMSGNPEVIEVASHGVSFRQTRSPRASEHRYFDMPAWRGP